MRRHAGDLLGTDTRGWEVVARHEVPDALPAQPAPYVYRARRAVGDVVVCGDHRDTGSIQGALVSGQRAAEEILDDAHRTSWSSAPGWPAWPAPASCARPASACA